MSETPVLPPPPPPLPPLRPGFCASLNKAGQRCGRWARKGKPFCDTHEDAAARRPRPVPGRKERTVYLASLVRADIARRKKRVRRLEKAAEPDEALLDRQRADLVWKFAVLRDLDAERDALT